MKSSYEIAMERLQAESPDSTKPLTDDQKKQLAEINKLYKAKIAEREVFLLKTQEEELSSGNHEEAEKVATQLRNERALLQEEMEEKKDKIRNDSQE